MTLRRPAQRGGVSGPSRRLPRLLSHRVCIHRRGEKVLDGESSDIACGSPHDRALISGARRRLPGSVLVGWRRSLRLAAKGASWSGENLTVRVGHPRLCVSLVVGSPQVLSGPPERGDAPRNAVYGSWMG